MDMGYADFGGGPGASASDGGHSAHQGVGSQTLTVADDRPADVEYELVARQETFTLASGRSVDGYTLNGGSPGPTVHADEGDLVQVTLTNGLPDGATLHWHGVDVPNAMDGVAGVTQNAVMPWRSRSPIGSSLTRWAPTGTTRTRCRTSR